MALLTLIALYRQAPATPVSTPEAELLPAQPPQAGGIPEILLNWSPDDIVFVGAGMGIFWVLAKLCERFGRAEFWLVAALIPCWQLAFAIGIYDPNTINRGYLGAILVATLWWFLSGRGRANRPFDPRWIVALPVSGWLLLQPVNWYGPGLWWPIIVAAGQLAAIGLLRILFGSRSTTSSVVSSHEQPPEPPAPEEPRPDPIPRPTATGGEPPSRAEEPRSVPPPATARTARLFISYRREDSPDVAGRIYDRLVQRFGKEQVFKDVDSIPLGVDFRKHLQQVVGNCDLVLAVLGREWLSAANTKGGRRLDDLKDFVRIELEAALQRDIPVIPILVRGAAVPLEADLPESLAPFAYRNGIPVRADPDFHHDMDRLIEGVEAHLAQRGS